jgi:hypothetical protein
MFGFTHSMTKSSCTSYKDEAMMWLGVLALVCNPVMAIIEFSTVRKEALLL